MWVARCGRQYRLFALLLRARERFPPLGLRALLLSLLGRVKAERTWHVVGITDDGRILGGREYRRGARSGRRDSRRRRLNERVRLCVRL